MRKMFKTKIWLDDIRPAPEGFFWAKTYKEAIWAIKIMDDLYGKVDFISFDHDLGGEQSGYDVAKYLVRNQIVVDKYVVHSANPVGKRNIEQLLNHYGYKKYY